MTTHRLDQTLRLDQVSIRYDGQKALAVAGASLVVDRAEFVVLVGRSGCGKTTLLSLAAGFIKPFRGRVTVAGRPVVGPGADRAVVFQGDALFPWVTARDNVAFPLKVKGVPAADRRAAADRLLALVHLDGLGSRRVWELSGGQRQRVGLARALAAAPDFLLMDEPLGALDALTRERMQTLLLEIWRQSGAGVLMVTHGIEEALLLGTRIVVMAPTPQGAGRIVHEMETGFSRRWLAGETVSAIKADPGFAAARAALTETIFEGDDA